MLILSYLYNRDCLYQKEKNIIPIVKIILTILPHSYEIWNKRLLIINIMINIMIKDKHVAIAAPPRHILVSYKYLEQYC